jgi:magnesium transporter/zinc transporter
MKPPSNAQLRIAAADAPAGFAWVYRFDETGKATPLGHDEKVELGSKDQGFLWLHLNLADVRSREWIKAQQALPEEARESLLGAQEHQQLAHDNRFVWGIFADFLREFDKTSDTIGHMRFVIGGNFLLSARRHPLHSAEAARDAVRRGCRAEMPEDLFETIIGHAIEAIIVMVKGLSDEIDAVEDRVLDDEIADERRRLGRIRRQAVRLRRQLDGMISIFRRIEQTHEGELSEAIKAAASRLLQQIVSLYRDIGVVQERARLLQEEVSAQLTDENNRNIYILTILTSLLLPATFVTGLFGMNTKGLFFAEDENGTLYAVGLCIIASIIVFGIMRGLNMLGKNKI